MSTTVTIIERSASPLRQLQIAGQSQAADREIGRAVVRLVQDNFHELPPNRRNFPSTGFWQRAAEATRYEMMPGGVRVSVNQIGVRQRLLGGEIKPIRGRYLTIPATAETYGHITVEFGPLKMVRVPFSGSSESSSLGLVPRDLVVEKSNPVNAGSVFFWLVKSATQQPNPSVLPGDEALLATARQAAIQALK